MVVLIKVAPSILSADFAHLAESVKVVEAAGADYLHIDVMDGHFVPNITIGPPVIRALRPHSRLFFDVHLMITAPERYLEDFRRAGADLITVHAETCVHLHRVVTSIKDMGLKAGVALNPATPLSVVEYLLPLVDLVLLMTVNPGFGGQAFIPEVLPKIERLAQMVGDRNLKVEIQVDGGIDEQTAPLVTAAGARVLVAGSAIFGASDPAEAVVRLRAAAAAALTAV